MRVQTGRAVRSLSVRTMSDESVRDKARRLLAAATPGPWGYERHPDTEMPTLTYGDGAEWLAMNYANAEFIAAAPGLVAALVTAHEVSEAELREAQARVATLTDENDEYDQLLTRLRELLTGVANGLRGEPPELVLWDWSDLPERAREMREALDGIVNAPNSPVWIDGAWKSFGGGATPKEWQADREARWDRARALLVPASTQKGDSHA